MKRLCLGMLILALIVGASAAQDDSSSGKKSKKRHADGRVQNEIHRDDSLFFIHPSWPSMILDSWPGKQKRSDSTTKTCLTERALINN